MSNASLAGVFGAPGRDKTKPPVSFFEFWPSWLFYAPVVAFWAVKALRHGSITLPALANPAITAGGICGESKNQILDLAGPQAREWIAPFVPFVTCGHADGDDLARARAALGAAGLRYPVVAKPDMSCNGVGVRVVHDDAELAAYLAAFPRATALQLQMLIPHEGEAGIFYIRDPDESHGRITSVTLKYPPVVTGDGKRSLRRLVAADARLNAVANLLLPKLGAKADAVPALGERVRLVFVGNHCRGSTFKDGQDIVTPALAARIDEIMRDVPGVYFSRIDLRYDTLDALREGRDFKIIEINGAGSEATNIWDPEMTLDRAYATQFFHYGAAFTIGAKIRRRSGVQPIGALRLLALWRQQKRLMAAYPAND